MPSSKPASETATESVKSASLRQGLSLLRHDKNQSNTHNAILAWGVETVGLLIAILAFIAIIITLAVHQGRPLPGWPHLISINALIAVFTAILKAALVLPVASGISKLKWLWFTKPREAGDLEHFDSASKGPWGSFLLLLDLRGRHLAALGALITVLATAIDPFSQQILKYHDCLRPVGGARGTPATIPITNYYGAGSYFTNGDSKATDGNMTAGIYLGLINPPANLSSTIVPNCATGNCTFSTNTTDTYTTVAMCSSCTDISKAIQNSSTSQLSNYTTSSGCQIGPGGIFANSMYVADESDDAEPSFVTIDTLVAQNNPEGNSWRPFAARCNLVPCVNTYTGNVSNGVLRETLVSSKIMPYIGVDFVYWYSLVLPSISRNGKDITCSATAEPRHDTDLCTDMGYTPYNFSAPNRHCWPNDCVWTLGVNPTGGIQALMLQLLNGTQVVDVDGVPEGVPWAVNLWNQGVTNLTHFETAFAGLADQITSVMRQKGDNSTTPLAVGTTLGLQTCIGVRWSWLSFPASLIALTIVFFAITILRISSSEIRKMWKSSSLVLLFHGLSIYSLHRVEDGQSEEQRNENTEDDAKKVTTKLQSSGSEFEFVEVPALKT
ncbi:uncharacterized protein Z520_06326 [Fonsecaea multimorphosa CBS 102226]|uniref:Uncharacterized protein n=1 Tax=Fonsecaea multimorphosa CBS 102226 TaxID=1442371 RepID=A0A0D2IMI4_9EURO|nr:uncharacterized protein Z520_06326 [Fonsecaea multimorphosa CBS 102226]KIX98246.1 hypothetical protein Z520_06326 [Fonsecaea multimorphosa CBS 102226]OAL22621.1 hypothetical protein AYO22_07179 [Fonsecaea multimorphosa]